MILAWNLNHYLNLAKELRQRQKPDDNVMSVNFDIIVIILIYG